MQKIRSKTPRKYQKLKEIKSFINERITRRAFVAKSMVSVWTDNHFGIAQYIRYNIPSDVYYHFVFVKLHSSLNMLSCRKGGFMSIRHNKVRELTAELLLECCKDVSTEPVLQQLTGETLPSSAVQSNEARIDVATRGFWVKRQVAYFNVKVFNPTAKFYLTQSLNTAHQTNEQTKKRAYNRRVNTINQGSFVPLVFTCFRGMSLECLTFYKKELKQLRKSSPG